MILYNNIFTSILDITFILSALVSNRFSSTLAAGKVEYIFFLYQPLTKELDEYILLVREMLESVVYCRSRKSPNAMATSTMYLGHKYFNHIFGYELLKLIEFSYIRKGKVKTKELTMLF